MKCLQWVMVLTIITLYAFACALDTSPTERCLTEIVRIPCDAGALALLAVLPVLSTRGFL